MYKDLFVSLVVATDRNGGIGRENQLLCHLPADLRHFKELTTGHPMIMGRLTFESIGKALPGRISIVITRNEQYASEIKKIPNCYPAGSLEEALELVRRKPNKKLEFPGEPFIVGGGSVYREAMEKELVDFLYLTVIEGEFEADTFFRYEPEEWAEIQSETHPADNKNGYSYRFVTLWKKKAEKKLREALSTLSHDVRGQFRFLLSLIDMTQNNSGISKKELYDIMKTGVAELSGLCNGFILQFGSDVIGMTSQAAEDEKLETLRELILAISLDIKEEQHFVRSVIRPDDKKIPPADQLGFLAQSAEHILVALDKIIPWLRREVTIGDDGFPLRELIEEQIACFSSFRTPFSLLPEGPDLSVRCDRQLLSIAIQGILFCFSRWTSGGTVIRVSWAPTPEGFLELTVENEKGPDENRINKSFGESTLRACLKRLGLTNMIIGRKEGKGYFVRLLLTGVGV